MRRWNGWGEEGVDAPLPVRARDLLGQLVGPGTPTTDAHLEDVVSNLAPSRLADDDAWTTDPRDRVLHARGQSLPDWVALRSGRLGAAPDAVARATSRTATATSAPSDSSATTALSAVAPPPRTVARVAEPTPASANACTMPCTSVLKAFTGVPSSSRMVFPCRVRRAMGSTSATSSATRRLSGIVSESPRHPVPSPSR